MRVLECVPNFSEGRDEQKIQAIADAIRHTAGASLLHIDISPAANRTVMTFAGEPETVVNAAYNAIQKAAEVIDMRTQDGVHPRIGATDVCPLVPLKGISVEEANVYAHELGERVGRDLQIPVYLYEYSARSDYRRALPDIRKGQYEGFEKKMNTPEWQPDYGPATFNAATGATVMGARDVLVAFNISLNTQDVEKANYIADRIRERGYMATVDGVRVKKQGLLPKLRAIGWYMADFECAQVSMNLLDYRITSPLKVWEACTLLANEIGVTLKGSELIGLMPESCVLEAGSFSFMEQSLPVPEDEQLLIHEGIAYLKLDKVKPFNPQEKILEYALRNANLL